MLQAGMEDPGAFLRGELLLNPTSLVATLREGQWGIDQTNKLPKDKANLFCHSVNQVAK